MALSATAITTLEKAKGHLGFSDRSGSFLVDAIDIYHDASGGVTAATVAVNENTIVGTATGGTGFTLTLTDAANDTISELVAVINAVAGWVAAALTYGDAVSAELTEAAAQSCLNIANRKKLQMPANRKLELIIEAVTKEIEDWLDRGIVTRAYDEEYYPDSAFEMSQVTLRQPEVTAIGNVFLGERTAMTVNYGGSDPWATCEVTDTQVTLINRTGATTTTSAVTFAANVTLTALAATINTLGGAAAGWTATITGGLNGALPSAFLVHHGARNAKSNAVALSLWDNYDGDYTTDYKAGLIHIGSWNYWPYSTRERPDLTGVARARVIYTAGFLTVPASVEQIAWDMIGTEWAGATADTEMQSESDGSYSYTLSGATLSNGSGKSASWRNRLAIYRRMLP